MMGKCNMRGDGVAKKRHALFTQRKMLRRHKIYDICINDHFSMICRL
jgi:hypothetical protein